MIRPSRASPVRLAAVLLAALVAGCELTGPASPSPSGTPAASPSPSLPSPSPLPSPSGPTPTPAPTFVLHVVAPGETLTAIARRYRTTPRSIAFWNREAYPTLDPLSAAYDPDRIAVGWQLRLIPGATFDESTLPSPSPSPRPTVGLPSPPPPPSPPADRSSLLVTHGPRTWPGVALTFDMGGRLDPALEIVDWLVAHEVRATIFPTGQMASTAEGRAVMARVAAHPELFAIGNHSWDHPDFRDLDPAAIEDQLTRTEALVRELTGQSTKPFFRPPFGGQNGAVLAAVGRAGWAYTVMWDIDTIDWKPTSQGGPTADDIVTRVLSRVRPGSIVLMHLGGYHTLDALPAIVDGLRDKGLEPVTLAEMFGG
ncbi:MAG TPA: polysaccharide deacetylase family protein [Candidatus Limnocylindrales bacterium]|nr:polysaccharide deacetylase family protein [Candidatus Limnocylindrales bacterium]